MKAINKLLVLRPQGLYAIFRPIKYLFFATVLLIASYFIKPYIGDEILRYVSGAGVGLMLLIYILNYLHIKSIVYTITDEQIFYKRGIFTITTDYIELYRIIDFKETRGFLYRFINAMNFRMETMDKSHPVFELTGIPKSDVDHLIRELVEKNRKHKVFVTE